MPIALWSYPCAATRGEGVAEPEAVLDGHGVGDVAERRRALVGGDDEIRVVAVVDDGVRRWTTTAADEVVGEVEHPADERAVALDDLAAQLVGI